LLPFTPLTRFLPLFSLSLLFYLSLLSLQLFSAHFSPASTPFALQHTHCSRALCSPLYPPKTARPGFQFSPFPPYFTTLQDLYVSRFWSPHRFLHHYIQLAAYGLTPVIFPTDRHSSVSRFQLLYDPDFTRNCVFSYNTNSDRSKQADRQSRLPAFMPERVLITDCLFQNLGFQKIQTKETSAITSSSRSASLKS
jgi:hypothetical protein